MSTQKHVSSAPSDYLSGFEQYFTSEASAFFDANGYYVFPEGRSPFPDAVARSFQKEIKKAYNSGGKFQQNKVEFLLPQGPIQLVKPNVFEYDLHNPNSAKDVPVMHNFFRGCSGPSSSSNDGMGKVAAILRDVSARAAASTADGAATTTPCASTCATLSTLKTDPHTNMTLKLQVNTGGCFPWHYDNPSSPNKRLLTLAVYLTDPYSEERDGGQIQLLPFLGAPITIAPSFNTVVLFRSDLLLHRVLPFKHKKSGDTNYRCCFTVWIDGSSTNMPDDVNLKAKHLVESFIPSMITSPVQRSLSRAVYDDIYQQALLDCFTANESNSSPPNVANNNSNKSGTAAAIGGCTSRECLISLKMHEAHVKQLMGNPALVKFIELLREKREF